MGNEWYQNYVAALEKGSQAIEGAEASDRPPGNPKIPKDPRPTMKKWGKYVHQDGSVHDHPEAEGRREK